MDLVLMLVMTLAGLGILLYGMSLFSRALESALGYRLNNKFMQMAQNPFKGYFFSALLTFCTQKSTLVSGMIMNYVSIGTVSLRQSLPMVLGLSFGNTISIILMIFQGLNITTFLTLLCFVGAIMNLFFKTEKCQMLARAFMGFGMLFLGLEIIGTYAGQIFEIPEIFNFIASINYPIVIVLLAFVFSFLTTSNFASLTLLAVLVMAGPVSIDSAVLGMLAVAIGTALADYVYTVSGQSADGKRVALYHLIAHIFGFVVMFPLYFTGVYTMLCDAIGGNIILTLIIVHMVQMTLPIILMPFGGVVEKLLKVLVREKKGKKDPYAEFILPDSAVSTFGVGYIAVLQSTKRILEMGTELQNDILEKIANKKEMRGINGRLQGLEKVIRITNNAVLRMTPKVSTEDLQKTNVLVNILSDMHYLMERSKRLTKLGSEIAKKPRLVTQRQIESLLRVGAELESLTKLDCQLIEGLINGQDIDNASLKNVLDFNKKLYALCQKLRKEVYVDYRKNGHLPESNIYFNLITNFEDVNTDLGNIAIKLGILSG